MMARVDIAEEGRHHGTVEEWLFTAWSRDADVGIVSGHRIVGRTAWYWAALGRSGRDLLHVADFDITVRADPFIVKGEALWAEHHCDAPFEQWTIGNETYASALGNPDEALGLAYGTPTPIAFDLEWYATSPVAKLPVAGSTCGYRQDGVVHGTIEILGDPPVEVVEIPAARWHRWTAVGDRADPAMAPIGFPPAVAHRGVRSPFAFPDGTVSDLVLASDGWHTRHRPHRGPSDP